MKKYLLILLTSSLLLSEIMLRIDRTWGFFLYALMITGCLIVLSKEENQSDLSKIIIIFLILPIIRIFELFLVFDLFWNVFIVYYVLLFLSSFYLFKSKMNIGYTKKGLYLLPLIVILSINLGFLGRILFEFENNFRLLLLIPLIAYTEEILFRGLIQNSIEKNYGLINSIIFTTLLYGIFSLSLGYPLFLLMSFASLIMSIIYIKKNIFLTISMNMIIHIFLFI